MYLVENTRTNRLLNI